MNFKSRKLLCAGICFLSACGLLAASLATFSEWADFVKWIFGIYAAGNVGEHVAKKKPPAAPVAPAPAPAPVAPAPAPIAPAEPVPAEPPNPTALEAHSNVGNGAPGEEYPVPIMDHRGLGY